MCHYYLDCLRRATNIHGDINVNREVCFISDPGNVIRASEQEKEIQGGMAGKRSVGAEVLVAGVMQNAKRE